LLTLSLNSNKLLRAASNRKPLTHSFLSKRQAVAQIPPEENPEGISGKEDTEIQMRVIRSEDILSGNSEILIRHGSEIYRLRLTRAGKLILTK
jgi:hemin uptake protein HemP